MVWRKIGERDVWDNAERGKTGFGAMQHGKMYFGTMQHGKMYFGTMQHGKMYFGTVQRGYRLVTMQRRYRIWDNAARIQTLGQCSAEIQTWDNAARIQT